MTQNWTERSRLLMMLTICGAIAAIWLGIVLFRSNGAPSPRHQDGDRSTEAFRVETGGSHKAPRTVISRLSDQLDNGLRLRLIDHETRQPIVQSRVYSSVSGTRSMRHSELSLVAEAERGDIDLSAEQVRSLAELGSPAQLTCWHDDYIPTTLALPDSPGTYEVTMLRGRRVFFRVVGPPESAIQHASVAVFDRNVDRRVFDADAFASEVDDPLISVSSGNWYARPGCSSTGEAWIIAPNTEIVAVPVSTGHYSVRGHYRVGVNQGTAETPVTMHMAPVLAAVYAKSGAQEVLGSTTRQVGREWRAVRNMYARRAAQDIKRRLVRDFPGDLVFVDCLTNVTDKQAQTAPFSARALIAGYGLLDLHGELRPYSEMRARALPDPPVVPCGEMRVPNVPGYSDDMPTPLLVTNTLKGKNRITFDVKPGAACFLPEGDYAVYQRRSGLHDAEFLASGQIRERVVWQVPLDPGAFRWALEVCVSEFEATPTYCMLRVKKEGTLPAEEFLVSPRNAASVVVFLEDGIYSVGASAEYVEPDWINWTEKPIVMRGAPHKTMLATRW